MIEAYQPDGGRIRRTTVRDAATIPDDAVWVDLLQPSGDERAAVERLCRVEMPTLEKMREIEVSSRLYSSDDADFMTASVVHGVDDGAPNFAPVTFVLAGGRLVTLRYTEPKSFATYARKLCREPENGAREPAPGGAHSARPEAAPGPDEILVGLLETMIDRVADMLESIAADLDGIADDVFSAARGTRPVATANFKSLLRRIGAGGELSSRTRESLATLDRLMPFLQLSLEGRKAPKDTCSRVKAMSGDIQSLNDFVSFLSNKTAFLLDTTVGLISIEQNAIIKIFSVAAVGFMPPTLVASIYGMNFQHMPELAWPLGYPFALMLMVLSAVLPLLFFRYKRWL